MQSDNIIGTIRRVVGKTPVVSVRGSCHMNLKASKHSSTQLWLQYYSKVQTIFIKIF